MGTTPIYAIPYAEPSDPVANFPATDKAAAEAVEAALTTVPAVRMTRMKNVAQSLASAGTPYVITYELEDTGGGQGAGGIGYNAGIFTVPRSGVYQVNVTQHFQASSGTATLRLTISGILVTVASYPMSGNASFSLSRAWRCAANDQIKVEAQHTVAGTAAYGAGTRYSVIDISLVAP